MTNPIIRGVMVLSVLATVPVLPASGADGPSSSAEWGSLRGRFVLSGERPEPERLDITRDEEFCGQHDLHDESLVVHPENAGIRWVIVWLDSRDPVPVHPDAAKAPAEPPRLDNRNCRFEPRVMTVRTGQEYAIANSDPIAHNAAVFARRNQPFSVVISQNQPLLRTFQRPETSPVRVDCSIHAWMRAWLVVTDHPYAVATDADGRFELADLPAGSWKFRFWHERTESVPSFLQDDGTTVTLERGVREITIPAGETVDLGELRIPAEHFAESP